MADFAPKGRRQVELSYGDWGQIVVTADVDFDNEVVVDWSAEDWHGNEALVGYSYDDIYDLVYRTVEAEWRKEQKLVELILSEPEQEVI